MVAHNLAVVVVELKCVSGLRQLAFEVIPEESLGSINGHKRHTFKLCAESWMDSAAESWARRSRSQERAVVRHQRSIRGPGETERLRCRVRPARGGNRVGHARRIELRLGFPEYRESKFVHRGRADGA